MFWLILIESFSCLITTNNNKPKHNSIEAKPKIKNVIEKEVTSSTIEPTILAITYKITQTNSETSIKEKKLLDVNKKTKKLTQKIAFIKTSQFNILIKT